MAPPMEPTAHYPPGTVRALLGTPHVTPATRAALGARLAEEHPGAPRFFDAEAYAVLRAVCARLIPQPDRGASPIDLAAMVDTRFATGAGNGWRYAALPPDPDAYRDALAALDADAIRAHARPFIELASADQDTLLRRVQAGETAGLGWAALPPTRLFEELLAEVTECYYSHPLAQEEIGYVGMADVAGWPALGLDVLDVLEPRPRGSAHGPSDDGAPHA